MYHNCIENVLFKLINVLLSLIYSTICYQFTTIVPSITKRWKDFLNFFSPFLIPSFIVILHSILKRPVIYILLITDNCLLIIEKS